MEEEKKQLDAAIEAAKSLASERVNRGSEIEYGETKQKASIRSHPSFCELETFEKINLKKDDEIRILDSGELVYFQNCRPHRSYQSIVSHRTQATYEKQGESHN